MEKFTTQLSVFVIGNKDMRLIQRQLGVGGIFCIVLLIYIFITIPLCNLHKTRFEILNTVILFCLQSVDFALNT